MTQPNDPRPVRVIVEFIEHTRTVAHVNERGDLIERPAATQTRRDDNCWECS